MKLVKKLLTYLGLVALGYLVSINLAKRTVRFWIDDLPTIEGRIEVTEEDGDLSIFQTKDGKTYISVTTNYPLKWYLIGVAYVTLIYLAVESIKKRIRKSLEKEESALSEVTSHPRYEEFLDADPENRYIYKEQTPSAFEKWLKEQDANKTVQTTSASARV